MMETEPLTLRVDTSYLDDAALVRWARERIAKDASAMSAQMRAADLLNDTEAKYDLGLHFELGIIMVRDLIDGTIYVPGPTTTLIGQTPDGHELLWRDGEAVYDVLNPAATD